MAVKVYCSMCDSFIKDVHNSDFRELTGKEICGNCAGFIRDFRAEVEGVISTQRKQISEEHDKMNRRYATLRKAHDKYDAELNSKLATLTATLDRRLEELLE